MVKGKAEPVPIFRPSKLEKKSILWDKLKQSVKPQKIYGRMKQTAEIAIAIGKNDGVILIQGEPGIGKSVMLDYVMAEAQAQTVHYLKGAGDSLEKESPFFAWRPIFLQIFGLHKSKQMIMEQKMKEILSKLNIDWLEYGKK